VGVGVGVRAPCVLLWRELPGSTGVSSPSPMADSGLGGGAEAVYA
jgi:hypothetical protein